MDTTFGRLQSRYDAALPSWADLDESEVCSECGVALDLDGWDGLCGNCADRKEEDDGDEASS